MSDVFISYHHGDRPAAERIASALRQLKVTTWYDQQLSPGRTFSTEINERLNAAKAIIVCWSPESARSKWVLSEAHFAFEHDKLISGNVSSGPHFPLPVPYNSTQVVGLTSWLGAQTPRRDAGWLSVLGRVGELVERDDIASWARVPADVSVEALDNWLVAHRDTSPLFVEVENFYAEREAAERERRANEFAARQRMDARVAAKTASAPPKAKAPFVVAVDGVTASGKGTIAAGIAKHYGLRRLDTGALYRAVALVALDAGYDPRDPNQAIAAAEQLDPFAIDETRIRSGAAGMAASIIAANPTVRAILHQTQRKVAAHPDGAVLDGRDIGTAVCPDADVKLFVTADLPVRTLRRLTELRARGEQIEFEALERQIAERDHRDRTRAVSPLYQAPDAHLLDTTHLSIEGAVEAACRIIDAAVARPRA